MLLTALSTLVRLVQDIATTAMQFTCVVISTSCEPQTLDAVDSVLVNYLASVRFIYKGQNDITYSDSSLHVITLFGYLLTVHDT